ncbi:metal-dependent hydrolase [Desulfothermobacter acidiphilus]|uniref:metal-dependent hydrolase n=1 Tax=Desulfothermobacter acidiphilus TaxID=1938353 RepID=UPI003F8A8FB9
MTGRTHLAAGAFVGALAGKACGDPVSGAVVGAVAGLLPDVDHPGSTAGRVLWPVAVLLENTLGHRTITHTVWFCAAVGLLLSLLAGLLNPFLPRFHHQVPVALAFLAGLLGSLSHLALDALTRSGIRPFWPLEFGEFRGPFVTGDPLVEWPALVVFGFACLKLCGAF